MLEGVRCEKCGNEDISKMVIISHCPIVAECVCRHIIVTNCHDTDCSECPDTNIDMEFIGRRRK